MNIETSLLFGFSVIVAFGVSLAVLLIDMTFDFDIFSLTNEISRPNSMVNVVPRNEYHM